MFSNLCLKYIPCSSSVFYRNKISVIYESQKKVSPIKDITLLVAHSVCICTIGSIPSASSVSVFVFITYSWHPTRTGSAAPGFGKKEQAVDEQVSLTHLHGSTRKNKRERVGIAKGKKKKRERGVTCSFGCVMLLADCLLWCHRVPDMPVQLTQLFGRRKGRGEIAKRFLIPEGQGSLGSPRGSLNPALTPGTSAVSPERYQRCPHNNPAQNCLCLHQILPLWLLENSSAQLYPTNQKCQAFPSQG